MSFNLSEEPNPLRARGRWTLKDIHRARVSQMWPYTFGPAQNSGYPAGQIATGQSVSTLIPGEKFAAGLIQSGQPVSTLVPGYVALPATALNGQPVYVYIKGHVVPPAEIATSSP